MSETQLIHITNWPSRKLHGPGKKFTIMAKPRHWEHGDGCVYVLCPRKDNLNKMQVGYISFEIYRQLFISWLKTKDSQLSPGRLMALASNGEEIHVRSGDTLLCSCSKEAASQGKCHRVWSADILKEHDWKVILDGKVL